MKRISIATEAFFDEAKFNTRRHFLKKCTSGLGGLAMSSILGGCFQDNHQKLLTKIRLP